jgi:hypothetical protein
MANPAMLETFGALGAAAAKTATINPATVRFSQSSIKAEFSAGGSVDELAVGLRSGAINPNSVPAIRLVERNGAQYTLHNRRLAAFQKAGLDVPYRMATPQEIAAESWKFTTKNEGTSIRIRGQP